MRELAALGRLTRIDGLRHAVNDALENNDLGRARGVSGKIVALYKGREDTRWARDRLAELQGDQVDAQGLLALAEREIMGSLDAMAAREVEAAARQVATCDRAGAIGAGGCCGGSDGQFADDPAHR